MRRSLYQRLLDLAALKLRARRFPDGNELSFRQKHSRIVKALILIANILDGNSTMNLCAGEAEG